MSRPAPRLPWRADASERHRTLHEVATELGLTSERVRQIESRAIHKLRQALTERGYRLEDLLDLDHPRREVRS